jgi:molecular chaperone GrpE
MQEKDVKTTVENTDNDLNIDINADSEVPGTSHLSNPIEESSEVEKLLTEVAELKDKYLRQAAEFDNYRKRSAKERIELIQTAGKEIITSLLDVLDDCDRAQAELDKTENADTLKTGVQLVFNKLHSTLQAKGLKEMKAAGEDFNADLHEAITEIPAPAEDMKGKVVDVVQKGYYLGDKIVRFAKVVVGK